MPHYASRCLNKLNFSAEDIHITHWSGKHKPKRGMYPNEHPIQRWALKMYLDAYCSWGDLVNASQSDPTCAQV